MFYKYEKMTEKRDIGWWLSRAWRVIISKILFGCDSEYCNLKKMPWLNQVPSVIFQNLKSIQHDMHPSIKYNQVPLTLIIYKQTLSQLVRTILVSSKEDVITFATFCSIWIRLFALRLTISPWPYCSRNRCIFQSCPNRDDQGFN